ncbi:dentin sialophosphoprotein-like isoform X6 [Salarias fasciatus]|uniref:dentin sialophosphoprotein-like isoform X6 n=1 Tax=Salarias fasciatus TaxID=181472 RepID=UPI0011766CCC|nr:dentin sialophosphoprotein-like isoform X6 [Salarias fasciatus]
MVHGHFLVVFISLLHLAAAENVKYALLGQTVILDPEIKASGANNILWKHSGNKVVEFNGNEQLEYEPFKDRITLDWHTAELEITDLRYEDSGDYELEMFMNKEFIPFTFKLKVIGKVSRPSISCEIEDTSSDESGNRASLKCSAESSRSESFMKFEWSWRGSMQPGPNLTIPLGDENDEEEYSCTVSNPMSRETTTFSARSCYSETNLAGIIVGCVIAVIAVPLVVLLLFLKRRQRKPEQNRSDPEQNPLMNTQPTSQSPPQPAGFAEENDDTELVDVKKTTQNFQEMIDEHENSTPAKPPGLAKVLSPSKMNFSVTSQEGGIDEHKKENNLDQVSGELPQNPAGESSLEEKNQSDEENRSDPEQRTLNGGLSTSQSPLQSPDCAQEDDGTEPDKGINSPSGKPPHTPKPPSPPAPDSSNTPDEGGIDKHKEDNNSDQITGKLPQDTAGESSLEEGKQQTEVLQGSKPEISHIGIDIPNGADTAAANLAEKDNTVSDSQSTSDNEASDTKEEPAGQQEDQVPVNPTPGDAKDSEMSLAADGVGDSPTETQTSGQIENEPDPENSKQEETKNTKDDQEENQQPESQRSSRQGSHDSLKSAGISTDQTDKQDKVSSRRSSQSENNSKETGGDEGERQDEQRDADASEHVDSAKSVSDKVIDSPTPATGEPSQNPAGESSLEDKNQSDGGKTSDPEHKSNASTEPGPGKGGAASSSGPEGADEHENSTPAKPPGLAKVLSPSKLNFSVTSQEGGIDKQNKENNLDQVSGELPQNPAGESSLEDKKQSDEENRSDPEQRTLNGGLSTSQSPLQSPDCAQEDDDTEPDKGINSPSGKPPHTPTPPSPPAPDPSNIADEGGIDKHEEDNNSDQITGKPPQNPAGESSLEEGKQQTEILQGSKPEVPHIGGKTSDPEHKSNASTEPGPGKGGAASSSGPEGAEQNRSDPEQNPLLNTQPTSQSPPQPAGFAEENDDTESVDVKKTTQNFQQMMVTSQEGGIDKQNKENNLDQVSGELPQNPAGESSLEEKNPSDEENRSDPEQRTLNGGLSTSPSPLQSPDCAQEDDDTEPDKGINSPSGKPPHTPTPLSPPAPDPSNTPDEGGIDKHKEDNNLDQITGKPPQHTTGESSLEEGKHQTEVLQGSKPEIPHIGIDIPIVADTAAANQAEKDNIVSNSQSTSDNEASDTKEEPAGQQEDQVPVNPTPGDAKDSEMSLAADGVGDSPTETQTSGQIENEPDPENSKQEENKNTKDDQEENQQPESQRSSRQGSHDSLKSAGISTDETDKQDKVSSRRSSQSENNSDATGGDEGEKQNEQRDADASEHVDSANSDKESNSPTPATGEPSPNTSGESSSEDKNQSNDKHENSTPAKPPGLAKALSPLKFNFSVTSQEGGIDKQNKENNLDQVSGELPQNPAGESSLEEKNPSDEENKGDPDKGKINNKESDPGKEGAASSSGAEGAEKKRSDGEQNLSVTSPALRLLQGNLTDINTKTTSSQEQDPGSSSGPEGADEEIYATPPRSPEPSPPPATDCSNTPDKPKKGNEVSAEITKKH